MKFEYSRLTGYLMMGVVVFISACASENTPVKSSDALPVNTPQTCTCSHVVKIKSLNIFDVYKKFSPTEEDFAALFKKPLSTATYKRYQIILSDKLTKIDKKFINKQLTGPRSIYKQDISTRRQKIKKEWLWGKDKKKGIKRYYKQFKTPWKIYEYKTAYQLFKRPASLSKQKIDTKAKDKNKKKKEVLLKTEPTKVNIVLYFYRLEGKSRIYIIDPDVFIKSML